MNTEVLFEIKDGNIYITLDKDSNYSEIKKKLEEILEASEEIFKDVTGEITIQGRRLIDKEETEIGELLKTKTELGIKIERPKQMGLATINNIFNKDTTITNAKVITGTIRSGQRVDFEGSIIVLGDVNGGSEIIAEENIIILGNLRGFAHAGAKGNRSAYIAANNINPTQLRIADIILRSVDEKREKGNSYDLARIDMGEIVIER